MRCKKLMNLLEAYVEGELSISQKMEVDIHLARCKSCRKELAIAQRIPHLVRSISMHYWRWLVT